MRSSNVTICCRLAAIAASRSLRIAWKRSICSFRSWMFRSIGMGTIAAAVELTELYRPSRVGFVRLALVDEHPAGARREGKRR
jgi:hypothetical protein